VNEARSTSKPVPRLFRRIASRTTWAVLLLASGCVSPVATQLPRLARGAGATEQLVAGDGFHHRLFRNGPAVAAATGPLLIFLEGDGRPWANGGRTPAADPTGREPLAFQLFAATPLPAWYITRPCYEGLHDPRCEPSLWTGGRYSQAVVDSLAAALRTELASGPPRQLVLIGHSGGGVLATLLASRLQQVRGVITIAANLDVAAWARLHGYLPLADSLDPARQAAVTDSRQIALIGGRDRNVPPAVIEGYLLAHPETVAVRYADFDHVCCWRRDWGAILSSAMERLLR
jgi:pimeloyl-ACP methyl ester carboxylesterase